MTAVLSLRRLEKFTEKQGTELSPQRWAGHRRGGPDRWQAVHAGGKARAGPRIRNRQRGSGAE